MGCFIQTQSQRPIGIYTTSNAAPGRWSWICGHGVRISRRSLERAESDEPQSFFELRFQISPREWTDVKKSVWMSLDVQTSVLIGFLGVQKRLWKALDDAGSGWVVGRVATVFRDPTS